MASEPEINKPLNLAFDDRGRLWVTSTVEYPYPAKEGTRPRDSVKILSDFRADGRAQKVETFADGLNIPIGLLPLPSARAAIVHNIPNIYLMQRHRRRRPGRYPRRALRSFRQTRYARDDQRVHLGLRRLDLCVPRVLQRLEGRGKRPSTRSA